MQHASGSSNRQHEPGWPLLHLPAPAAAVVAKHLTAEDSKSLRLVCKAAQGLVETHATRWRLRLAATGEQPKGLPQRFPHVTHLLLAHPDSKGGGQGASQWVRGRWPEEFSIGSWEQWPAVTQLTMPYLPTGCTAALLASLPNISQVALVSADWYQLKYEFVTDSVAAVCSELPALKSLSVSATLQDEELEVVADCSTLTALTASVDLADETTWEALQYMKQLAALDVTINGEAAPPPDAFEHLTALTALACSAIPLYGDEEENRAASVCHLQLPPSLLVLRLGYFPLAATPVLPHLTTCTLDPGTADPAALAALSKCSLASLTVSELHLTSSVHATPLLSLTQLKVTKRFRADAGTRLAKVAPRLMDLALRCDCQLAADASLLANMPALRSLDGSEGSRYWSDAEGHVLPPGVAFNRQGLQLLASFTSLQRLRLNALPQHIKHWDLLLGVAQLEWVFGEVAMAKSKALIAAMHAGAPQRVRCASFNFVLEPEEELWAPESYEIVEKHNKHAKYRAIVEAATMMLALAPHLATLRWTIDTLRIAAMTDFRIWGLVANASITRIEIVGSPLELPERLRMHIQAMQASRGLQLVVLQPEIS